jgi:mannose/cellobiose epimerase-like protein (N-acyl-D-glucosamine 2-epimerase family)
MTSNKIDFSLSDLIMGYVQGFDGATDTFTAETTDGRTFEVELGQLTAAETLRNLGEPYHDVTASMRSMLTAGRMLFVYGTFLPRTDGTARFQAKHLVFPGDGGQDFRFEERTWWVDQIRQLADFYLNAEFGDGPIDWNEYRTTINVEGQKMLSDTHRQECDTISRLVYGFASAFMLTGDDRFLEAAEKGTQYLRDHFRGIDSDTGIEYWYHAIDLVTRGSGPDARVHERKIFASEFGDDYDAIPMYEQIYALAGPVQTYRATGDARVLGDVVKSAQFFDRFFLDEERGGYFSHVDPVTYDPRSESLGKDRARKNWNSVGDHAPAYLINVVAATGGAKQWREMLTMTADTIIKHFGDYENSPFVNERFFEDWSKDQSWSWQQNRAVVGHNLKIAWNLMRVHSVEPREEYVSFARRIAELMPAAGSDLQRGGWYDVVERTRDDGDRGHAFAWHDRKAWWQQEQAILAYLILAGSLGDPEYRRRAREAAAFYNAWFLDHDSGGIYFNVLANGIPYLMGTERLKGSHAMAGYHSFELCYLAATYTNLMLTGQGLDLYFRPVVADLPDRVLHVAPDLLPAGTARIGRLWIDGEPSDSFDAEALTVRVPEGLERPKLRVELVPAGGCGNHDVTFAEQDGTVTVTLSGCLGAEALPRLRTVITQMVSASPRQVLFNVCEVDSLAGAVVRELAFGCQKLDLICQVTVCGASPEIRERFLEADLAEAVDFV